MAIRIKLPWKLPPQAISELFQWCIETYGLPGDRMLYNPTTDWMIFTFHDENDALFFQLKTAGSRIDDSVVEYNPIGQS